MIDLPLFDAGHRAFARTLDGVEDRFSAVATQAESGDVDGAAREAIRVCAELGLCRRLVPRDAGGEGLDLRTLCQIREALAAASGFADAVFAVQGLGSYPIGVSGNVEMAARYLADVRDGRTIAAFALTEPNAGSDAGSMTTRAVSDNGTYVLNGTKTFISNATVAGFFTVFARTSDAPRRAISAFVVDAQTPGLRIGRQQHITAPHAIAEVHFEDCRVPSTARLGDDGDGMRLALGTLDFFRASVGAAACGLAARGLREALARAASRRQFGERIADFQLTQAALAEMSVELDAARLLVYRAAWLKDSGRARVTRESSQAKLFATEAAQRIVDRAVQIHGGVGVERGSVVERLYREVRALRIYEGTSEIQKLVIARTLLGGSEVR